MIQTRVLSRQQISTLPPWPLGHLLLYLRCGVARTLETVSEHRDRRDMRDDFLLSASVEENVGEKSKKQRGLFEERLLLRGPTKRIWAYWLRAAVMCEHTSPQCEVPVLFKSDVKSLTISSADRYFSQHQSRSTTKDLGFFVGPIRWLSLYKIHIKTSAKPFVHSFSRRHRLKNVIFIQTSQTTVVVIFGLTAWHLDPWCLEIVSALGKLPA